ncbi:hypothetical protein BaRGS_00037032, partial [Batillaria attramentaria]
QVVKPFPVPECQTVSRKYKTIPSFRLSKHDRQPISSFGYTDAAEDTHHRILGTYRPQENNDIKKPQHKSGVKQNRHHR